MKNILFILFFSFISLLSFGQIYSVSGTNQSITITPQGITSKLPNTVVTTNVALGRDALKSITTNGGNTAVGDQALSSNTNIRNSAYGSRVLYSNITGTDNAAFGNNALENSTVSSNTAFGSYSLNKNTGVYDNLAIGVKANSNGAGIVTNGNNTAVGYYALYANNPASSGDGAYNTAIGAYALQNNTEGYYNTTFGHLASKSSIGGVQNVVIGNNALFTSTEGNSNTVIGSSAAYLNNFNGQGIMIGYNAGYNEVSNNILYISNSNTTTPLIGGVIYQTKVSINRDVTIAGGNNFLTRTEALQVGGDAFKTMGNGNWQFISDRRLKKNIVPLNSEEMLSKVLKMRGVNYEMIDNSQKGIQFGFIAQELQEVFPAKIKENSDSYLSADYGSYTAIEVEAIKALNEKIEALEKYNETLAAKNHKLRVAKQQISEKLDSIEADISAKNK